MMKKNKTKKRIGNADTNRITPTTIIAIIAIVLGLLMLLYPTIADYINTFMHRRAINNYQTEVEQIDDTAYNEMLEKAYEYNERLAHHSEFMLALSDAEREEYNRLLDITGTGIMGYVDIPKIDISLPIYHGTTEEVLQSGAGHLEGSSLPIGGLGCHAVISAHRGLPSARLFTDLDYLVEGDYFSVTVLREEFIYKVSYITSIDPDQTDEFYFDLDKDYCTLLTCTPYGVNTQRLLVKGERVYTQTGIEEARREGNSYQKSRRIKEMIIMCYVLLLLIIFLGVIIHKEKKKLMRRKMVE